MRTTVLIVEDDCQAVDLLAHAVLNADDLELVGVAGTLADGRRMLNDSEPNVALVDLGLPDGNGVELITWISQQAYPCESIAVTVLGDPESIVECVRSGVSGYILKDATADEVASAVRLVRSGGSPLSALVARRLLNSITGTEATATGTPDRVLSKQELEVLRMSARAYTVGEVAAKLELSPHTVGEYIKRIYRKLNVHSKVAAIHEARKRGLMPK